MDTRSTIERPKTGLIMTGGGARAAYQVGVLRAISEILPKSARNPFPIICGTSAGAINAAALAINASQFRRGVRRLMTVWKNFHVHHVYRADAWGVMKSGARWIAALMVGGLGRKNPISLLDNSPLMALLKSSMDFSAIQDCIDSGDLIAFSVTASGYTSGQSVCFYQGATSLFPWRRARRIGYPAQIKLEHLMGSSALPFIFPAVKINREFFGDGSMRQMAPISPALHLGADRVMIIASGRAIDDDTERVKVSSYPSLAQIAGHALNSIFLDSMEADLERLQRINKTISLIPHEMRRMNNLPLRHIDFMVISPSEELEKIAERHTHSLPKPIRFLLRGVGALRRNGSTLVSYLLFEKQYCRALITLGYKDAMARKDEILKFLGHAPYDNIQTSAINNDSSD